MKLSVKYNPKDDTVMVDGYAYHFDTWVNLLDKCVSTHREFMALEKNQVTEQLYRNFHAADRFLWRNGVSIERFNEDVDELFGEILPKLKLPKDSPLVSTKCRVCGNKIWGRKSLITGIGGKCRERQ